MIVGLSNNPGDGGDRIMYNLGDPCVSRPRRGGGRGMYELLVELGWMVGSVVVMQSW